jgi:AraC-like DNA-binding protein
MRFLREARVEAARDMLARTDQPLRVIAPQVGFADEFQLSRVFKRVTGRSPKWARLRPSHSQRS